ncbi:hypothetical protein KAJ27_01615 [bacterium]|nr:hypothetical protein [bacterium]
MDNYIIKKLKLGNELESSITQITTALKELQTTVQETCYYFIAFQLLSNGFERLLKCSLCYGHLHKSDKFPSLRNIRTHSIFKLLDTFLSEYFVQLVPALKEDYNFLTKDKELKILVQSLTEFGKNARYHNLNVVTGNPKAIDIEDIWKKLETDFVMNDPELKKKLFDEPDYDTVDSAATRHFVSIFERLTRAIVRQFTLGDMGNEPGKYIGFYSHFLLLQDDQIGETDYYKEFFYKEIKKPKKYDKKNRNNKKTIKKNDYKELWPFKNADFVIVEKSDDDDFFLIINNLVYALNGTTAHNFDLPFAHDCGETYRGRDVSVFLTIAQKL